MSCEAVYLTHPMHLARQVIIIDIEVQSKVSLSKIKCQHYNHPHHMAVFPCVAIHVLATGDKVPFLAPV